MLSAHHGVALRPDAAKSIYVASSWRNTLQPVVVASLRAAGFEVYDFKNPPHTSGFSWAKVGLEHSKPLTDKSSATDLADTAEYLSALAHPEAEAGFAVDYGAMQAADTFVLVLPCGRSAHLELGWAAGIGKRTAVLIVDEQCTPELMYKLVDHVSPSLHDLLGWLGVED